MIKQQELAIASHEISEVWKAIAAMCLNRTAENIEAARRVVAKWPHKPNIIGDNESLYFNEFDGFPS